MFGKAHDKIDKWSLPVIGHRVGRDARLPVRVAFKDVGQHDNQEVIMLMWLSAGNKRCLCVSSPLYVIITE
jgi:hypothetical protein